MILFNDVKQANDRFREAFQQKLSQVLDSGMTILGNEVQTFERDFASYCGTEYCIGVANGLDALTLIFRGYQELGKLQPGDEVIVPANTYIASILAVSYAGLVPVPVEPDEHSFNISAASVEKAITPKTRAVMAVHLYGRLADMEKLSRICEAQNLILIEDAAQAHGAEMQFQDSLKRAGNLSHAAGFSFYPTKNLGALGDGGAVTTNNAELATVVNSLRNYGTKQKYVCEFKGINSRLDELQAAFLNVKLPFLDSDNDRRRAIANRYLSEINNPEIVLPEAASGDHVWHLFVIRCKDRDRLQTFLTERSIGTIIHYPVPPHKQKAYSEWDLLSFPITECIHNEVLSLPVGAVMIDESVSRVIQTLNEFR